jgi:endonuclease G
MKKQFTSMLLVVALLGCKKNDTTTPTPVTTYVHVPAAYVIKEDFEMGTKAAYAAGPVTIKTGVWSFDDALLGKLATDIKNNTQSVRLRTGKIEMNFDIDSISMIKINHAKFGSDGNSELTVWMSTDKGVSYTQIGNTLTTNSSTFITDSIKITGNKPARFQIRKLGTTRVNIDDIIFIGAGKPGINFNEPADNTIDTTNNSTPTAGRGLPSGTGPDVPPSDGDDSNMLFGNPSNATNSAAVTENYLIDKKYYVISYSSTRATPNWVSWHLDESNLGSTPRQDNFAAFSGLPTGYYQVQSNSYSGSGFDRGHNCPSADRTSSIEANSSTFLMTNMIPQAPQNNQRAWADLETYLRGEVKKGYEVYTIMGSYGKGGTGSNGYAETINNGKVTVPKRVWKIAIILPSGNSDLLRTNADTRILAVDTPNENALDTDWKKYITTVDLIEKATGYDFLSKLSTDLQKKLQAKLFVP